MWIMPTAIQAPDVIVSHVGDQRFGFRVLTEEVFTGVRAATSLEVLILAVNGFHHQLHQLAGFVASE